MEYKAMILGICGLKNSGKDTVANYLVEKYNFEKRSYAAPLKEAAAILLDIPLHEIENFKNDDTVFVSTGYRNHPTRLQDTEPRSSDLVAHIWNPIRELTFREFLQRFGTEMGREIFGKDFWVKQCLPHGNYVGKNIVISDCRFPNEVERIHNLGGKVIYIDRPITSLQIPDLHLSEAVHLLDRDYTIRNYDSIEYLYEEVEQALETLLV